MLRKFFLCILMASFMVGGVLTPPAFGAENVEFYVSHSGSDTNDGTFESPFKTIERAKEEVSKYTQNMTGDIYVYIRGGAYYIDKTITFSEADSGTNGHRVYYKNYANEQPIIYGGIRLTDWESYQDGIYKTKIPEDMDFYSLTENMEWATEACYPNKGYLEVAKGGLSDGRNSILYFKNGDIPEDISEEGLRVKNFPHLHYASATWPVTKIDRKNNAVHMNSKREDYSIQHTNSEGKYRLIGNISFLDSEGEFYVDRDKGVLYYYPHSADINNSIIVAPMVKRIFGFSGNGAKHLTKNITISGLTLSTTDFVQSFHQGDLAGNVAGSDAMIKLENAQNITIANCRLLNAGINAVWLEGFAQDNSICGNIIKNVGYVGILMSGYTAHEAMGTFDSLETAYCNKNNTIHNNYIRKVGINAAHGAGIQLFQSGDNIITHNEISHSPRYGISLKGESNPGGLRFWGIDIPVSDNWLYDSKSMVYDLRFSQNNYIAYNDLYDCMKETRDGGVFETNSAGRGNRFENNLVHDTTSADVGGMFFGIYIDGGSLNWKVEKNIVYNLSAEKGGASIIVNPGMKNQVQNNIIDESNGNVNGVAIIGNDTVFNKNVIYSSQNINIGGNGLGSLKSMENNLYYSEKGEYTIYGVAGEDTFESWTSEGKYDQNSVTRSLPGFADMSAHNYTFTADSPAKELGIEDAAISAGLTEEFVWERERNAFPEMLPKIVKDIAETDDPAGSLRLECESAEYIKAESPTNDYVGGVNKGSYIGFYGIDMTNVTQISVCYSVPSGLDGHLVEARLDREYSGTKVGSFVTQPTGGSKNFVTTTFSVTQTSGKHNIFLCFPELHSGHGNFDWVRFETSNGITPQKDILIKEPLGDAVGLLDYGDKTLVVNGECIYNSGAYISEGNLMIPLDAVADKMGFVHDSVNYSVSDTEGHHFTYTIGSNIILANAQEIELSQPVTINENGKVFLPAETFEFAFGDCVMYSENSGYCRIFDVNRVDLLNNPDNPTNDMAWRKVTVASSKGQMLPQNVVDGETITFWEPYYANREWIQIDLGSLKTFNTIQIDWGERYARAFEVYISESDELPINNQEPLYSYYTFEGGKWEGKFNSLSARFITIHLEAKGGVGASQIKDIRIYNK